MPSNVGPFSREKLLFMNKTESGMNDTESDVCILFEKKSFLQNPTTLHDRFRNFITKFENQRSVIYTNETHTI